jgi:predicted nucleic-acid-binding Zn-ribbon protein
MGEKKKPMVCTPCGSTMNYHADKLRDPRGAEEAKMMDPKLGGFVEEFHTCQKCGSTSSRHA